MPGDRFGASGPSSALRASWKSPVEMPRRYPPGKHAGNANEGRDGRRPGPGRCQADQHRWGDDESRYRHACARFTPNAGRGSFRLGGGHDGHFHRTQILDLNRTAANAADFLAVGKCLHADVLADQLNAPDPVGQSELHHLAGLLPVMDATLQGIADALNARIFLLALGCSAYVLAAWRADNPTITPPRPLVRWSSRAWISCAGATGATTTRRSAARP